MYLRSLEMCGFKSFAPRTVLNFERGVSCVVGPNGCGKSNVLDAMRWVLGEQSAKALRGGEMSDVIFSGTDSRAALSMAEVAMTFTDCETALGQEYKEVCITRRVYRDGRSEYLLNKTSCRLKDIHQLFMDTGIGRSAYSIMEQGKIDQILSSRPDDRRAIFEEAAGITKYKAQKKEALRKLEATEANLVRLTDIVREVKRQIGSLQRQAAKAKRYQSFLGDLKTLETHFAHRQWSEYEAKKAQMGEELSGYAAQQAELESGIEGRESEAQVRRAELHELERVLDQARREANDLTTRISNHENRIVFNEERMQEFEGLVERYRADIAASEEKKRVTEAQLHETDAELTQITDFLATELRQMEEYQAMAADVTAERQRSEREIGETSQRLAGIESRIGSLRTQAAVIAQQREGAEARLAILSGEMEQLTFAFDRIVAQRTEAKDAIAGAELEIERLTAETTACEARIREGQKNLATLDREVREGGQALAECTSRLAVLQQLQASGEGFGRGAQALMRGLDNPTFFRPAVQGPLAQFIDVEPEHVAAVEAALKDHLQAIIMKDTEIAEHAVRTLSGKKMGRATMMLPDLAPKAEGMILETHDVPGEALGWLINYVRMTPEVEPLLSNLLGDFILVENLDIALRIAPAARGFHFVTLTGETLLNNGLLNGGAGMEDGGGSVLQRKNEIVRLEIEVIAKQGLLEAQNERRGALQAQLDGLSLSIDELREARQAANLELSSQRGALAMYEREEADTKKKTETLDWERQTSEQRLREAQERLSNIELQILECEEQLEILAARRGELLQGLDALRERESETTALLNDLKIKVATERQRHASLHRQRAPLEARMVELEELIAQRSTDIDGYTARAATTEAETAEILANLEDLRSQRSEAQTRVSARVEERVAMAAEAEQVSNELRVARQRLTSIHEARSKLEVRFSQLEMRCSSVHDHIQKRYQIDLNFFQRDLHALRVAIMDHERNRKGSASESETSPADGINDSRDREPQYESTGREAFDIQWTALEQMVREIDQRLESMGPVNMDAIQEYDELEQRHLFLEQQNADLERSKAELMDILQKINTTTTQLFSETFEKIKTNFQEMFTELFGGGRASLTLSDEGDPLESGIEIIAKPPGKQLQSITLLSGGEKTMTAVSLLFSIYMVKPSPFCVLDEMDAPLDESNINRFIKILDRFVGQSQFVVISHNKKTIARADAIYGVTMEEHGVSKIVGVKFNRRQDAATPVTDGSAASIPSVAESFGKRGTLHSEEKDKAAAAASAKRSNDKPKERADQPTPAVQPPTAPTAEPAPLPPADTPEPVAPSEAATESPAVAEDSTLQIMPENPNLKNEGLLSSYDGRIENKKL